jgi:N-carbamoyl-L-amino-acid hydrolase
VATPEIDGQRLWRSLMEMAEVGALPGGGCCRLALSDADRDGRDLFVRWCREAGCEVAVDRVGNIFARRPGSDAGAAAVATGSHLDTQPHGGRFDGAFGVLAGLEVMRSLEEAAVCTVAPLEVVVWTNEEGTRFRPLVGSGVFAGELTVAEADELTASAGVRFADELARIGYRGELAPGERRLAAFVEAHIEQGPLLEAAGVPIGVVTGVQGIRWLRVELTGRDAHAGTTPMALRRDAVAGMAAMVTGLEEIARAGDAELRLTVGRVEVSPNSGGTIAGQVRFNVDLRHPETATLERTEGEIRQLLQRLAGARSLGLGVRRVLARPPVAFDPELVDQVRAAARRLGHGTREIVSGAGHDAMNIAGVAPSAMIFVPCRDGISHNEAEYASPEDLAAGAEVLLHTLLAKAGMGP